MRLTRRAHAGIALALIAALATGCTKSTNASAPNTDSSTVATSSRAAPKPTGAILTHPATIKEVLAGARAALAKLGTYGYKHYDADIKAAESHLTLSYASRYAADTKSLKDSVVRLKSSSAVSQVVAGVAEIGDYLESATVIVGFTQTLTGITAPHRRVTKVVALVGMVELNRKWLADSLAIPPLGPPAIGTPTLGSAALISAVAAGESEITILGTLRRKTFDADYRKWLGVTTGELKNKLASAEQASETAFAHSAADLSSVCLAAGVQGASSTKVVLLVYVSATSSTAKSSLYRLTLQNRKGHWFAASLTRL